MVNELTRVEKFAKDIVELADKHSIPVDEFVCSLQLAKEIIEKNPVSKQCLSNYEFPSQVKPLDINELSAGYE